MLIHSSCAAHKATERTSTKDPASLANAPQTDPFNLRVAPDARTRHWLKTDNGSRGRCTLAAAPSILSTHILSTNASFPLRQLVRSSYQLSPCIMSSVVDISNSPRTSRRTSEIAAYGLKPYRVAVSPWYFFIPPELDHT
jgi:hypothetical protein